MAILSNNIVRLVILTGLHFTVDIYAGLVTPLCEPTLTQHLGVDLAKVAFLIGGSAIVINAVQPLSGFVLPERGAPLLLVLAPLAAAVVACIGLTSSYWGVGGMLLVAAIGIGVLHPEATLVAHSLAGRRKGLAMSFFLAGGYFGFALGSLVAGVWVEYHDQGLTRFWLLALPGVLAAVLALVFGLHRVYDDTDDEESLHETGALPFGLVLALATAIAVNMCTVIRFLPIFMVRSFPGQDAQGWAGTAIFAIGLSSALGAFLWGHLSDRFGCGKVIVVAQILCAPFLYMLLHAVTPWTVPAWGIGVGATMGAVFPLSVVLARQSRGLGRRMRIGLAIGGAWGTGECCFILGGQYVGLFPEQSVGPVSTVLNACWFVLIATGILAIVVDRMAGRLPAPCRL